jgi:hypothetical protein
MNTTVFSAGVINFDDESLEKIGKGFDPSKSLLALRTNQAVDVVQRLSLVSAQDGYTKSIEFLSQMDKFLRRSKDDGGFGISWNEFFAAPDHHSKTHAPRYVQQCVSAP